MAQEWYLINTNHDTVSGFESDDFDNYSQDAFEEAVQSAIGENIEICNYDLTQRQNVRAIIQGNVQDTKLNALQRKLFVPIGTCKAGQYVFYKNRYWLIIGLVDDNKFYEKAVMIICNYYLTWINDKNEIVQRWACVQAASQYNNGEQYDKNILTKTDQLLVLTSDDYESVMIPHRKRFIIDLRCKFYEQEFNEDVEKNTDKIVSTYELTRRDNVIFNYQDSGHSEFMAYQVEQNNNDGYYKIDNKGYWLCMDEELKIKDNKREVLSSQILYSDDEPIIYNGIEPTVFIAGFTDELGNTIENIEFQWEINCDFTDKLNIEYIGNNIQISVDDKKLINKSFKLSLCADNYEKETIDVYIRAFI